MMPLSLSRVWRLQVALTCALAAIGCRGPESFSGGELDSGPVVPDGSGGFGVINVAGTGGAPGSGGGTGGAPIEDAGVLDVPDNMPIEDAGVSDTHVADMTVVDTQSPPDLARDLTPEVPKDTGSDTGDAPNPIEPHLVGYWKFDEGAGTSLRDSSGKANHAPVQGTLTWTTASANLPPLQFADPAAVVLGGGTASAGTTALPANNSAQTVSVWANLRTGTGDQYMLCLWNPSQDAVALGILGGQLTVWKWGTLTLVATAPPPISTWHHIAYTYDGTTHKLYLDGKTPITSTVAPNNAAVTRADIGSFGGAARYTGQLDDLRIYDVALTASQIARLAAGEFSAGP